MASSVGSLIMVDEDSSAKESAFCRSFIFPIAENISLPISLRSSATPSAKGFMGSDALMAAATALAAAAKFIPEESATGVERSVTGWLSGFETGGVETASGLA